MPADPAVQVAVVAQVAPHAPQFVAVVRLTHAVPHLLVVLPLHMRSHPLAVQIAVPVPAVGPEHTVPQERQFLGSVAVFTQVPLQDIMPVPQEPPDPEPPVPRPPLPDPPLPGLPPAPAAPPVPRPPMPIPPVPGCPPVPGRPPVPPP